MRNLLIAICLLFITSISSQVSIAQNNVRINEFMASNDKTLTDNNGKASDWIELYNAGAEDINLNGWSLTDDKDELKKWMFPEVTLKAKGFLVVYASGGDNISDPNFLHTNFKLSASGEYLALVVNDGTTVASEFAPSFPSQGQDISYGFTETGYQLFSIPTPGVTNISNANPLPPIFSVSHGVFNESFELELLLGQGATEIYYTTNANTPTVATAIKYTKPILIAGTTTIRAISVDSKGAISECVSSSYIFSKQVVKQSNNQPGYPENWLVPIHGTDDYYDIPGNYDMKQEFVNRGDVSKVIVAALESLPILSIVTDIDNLFSLSKDPDTGGIYMYNGEPDGRTSSLQYHLGRGWERKISLEYFNSNETDGNIDFQINCGIKIHGGASRTRTKTEKSSFKLSFKSEFGPSKLNNQIFGTGSANQYDRLILRGGFAPRLGLQLLDPWTKKAYMEMGQPTTHNKFVNVYINGLYWGMYNLSEQLDENFMEDYLGGDEENFDVIKDYAEVEHGDTDAWYQLIDMVKNNISDNTNYQKLLGNNEDGTPNADYKRFVEPKNLIDYMILNMYAGTSDWDHHNWFAARDKTKDEGFRFFIWDAEGTLSGKSIVKFVTNGGNDERPTQIFSDLAKNSDFKNLFVQQVNRHFFDNGALTPDPSLGRYEKLYDEIDSALICDQARWVYDSDDIWNTNYHKFIYNFFPNRTERVFSDFIKYKLYPDVKKPTFSSTTTQLPADATISLEAPAGGEIYYTLDGIDPGYYTQSTTPSIQLYNGEAFTFENTDTITIMARTKQDGFWSKLAKKQFVVKVETTSINTEPIVTASGFKCYPNPVKESTNFTFTLKTADNINLKIYDMLGKSIGTIANQIFPCGKHVIRWQTNNLMPGTYICVLQSESLALQERVIIIKN